MSRRPWFTEAVRTRLIVSAAVVALIAVGVGIGLVMSGLRTVPPAAAPVPEHTFTTVVEPAPSPDTDLGAGPAAPADFSTGASAPVTSSTDAGTPPPADMRPNRVYVPELGIDAPMVPISVASGRLDPPADPKTVGWNAGGGRLDGDKGTLLLTSHVNYVGRGLGAFYELADLKPNADVWTTDGEGVATHWVITELTSTPKTRVVDQTIFSPAGPRRLVLVTCGGEVRHGNYDHLVLAYATQSDA